MGIAGFGALASLAVYRDYFIGLALLALGYSFFITLRKKYRAGSLTLKGYRFGKDEVVLLITTALVVVAIFFPNLRGMTLAQSGASYEGRGSVVSLDERGKKITLKHEEIKGLMPAMTMEFNVNSSQLLDGVRQGDKVRFTLTPQGADFVVERIQKEE